MQDIKIYETISQFFASINLTLSQDFEFTIHDLDLLHGEPPTISPKFRTNYYAFLFIEEGVGQYTIDENIFELKPHTFYLTMPGYNFIASNTALGRVGVSEDIGSVVAFLCSDAARWVNAQRLEASGGMFL